MKKYFFLGVIFVLHLQSFSQKNIICTSQKVPESFSAYNRILDNITEAPFSESYYLCDTGKTLYVKFFNGSQALKQQFEKNIKEIETYANIRFRVVEGDSHFRIKFSNNSVIRSAIGAETNVFSQEEATVELDSTSFQKNPKLFKALVLHTACHMLGVQDEIFATNQGIKINKTILQKSYPATFNDEEYIEFLKKYQFNYCNQPQYNPNSIMVAPLPKQIANNTTAHNWNLIFTQKDKDLLAARYPKTKQEVQQQSEISFKNLIIKHSEEKNGYLLYPQFSFKSNKRSTFHFAVFIVDEEGKEVKVDYGQEENNLAGRLGDSKTFAHISEQHNVVNQNELSDIQFFILNTSFPINSQNKKLFAVFKVYEYNYEKEIDKYVFVSKPFLMK